MRLEATINYALGLFVGWWIWGRKLRDLRRVAEDTVRTVQQIINGCAGGVHDFNGQPTCPSYGFTGLRLNDGRGDGDG